ncbi:MAG TPA: hypothetical protein VEA18_03565 [Candidatus Kapabacteria bacterium]|nr:hypothetical protein [Candidatus Kapabacteria bacterium]
MFEALRKYFGVTLSTSDDVKKGILCALAVHPDIVIVDASGEPKGLDGIDMYRRLEAIAFKGRIAFTCTSKENLPDDVRQLAEEKHIPIFEKPKEMRALKEFVLPN